MKKTDWVKGEGRAWKSQSGASCASKGSSWPCEIVEKKGVEGMTMISEAANHLSLDEIRMKMKMTSGFWKLQKWLVIYNATIDPRPISEIAKHTGLSVATVQKIITEYNSLGPEAFEAEEKADRIRYYV